MSVTLAGEGNTCEFSDLQVECNADSVFRGKTGDQTAIMLI